MTRRRSSPRPRDLASRRGEIPSIVDLMLDPELAPLVLLDAAANVLIQALVAENPEMLLCTEDAVTAAFLLLQKVRSNGLRRGLTWDCAYVAPTAHMQYSSGSF